jgi:hypothetical protein
MNGALGMYDLLTATEPARRQLREHELFRSLDDIATVRLFMAHHVFAVWDFMALLKQLQRHLTCLDVPWRPHGEPNARRLINEIVMEEESDDFGELGYLSHFELYRMAMAQAGADCAVVDNFVQLVCRGETLEDALAAAAVPPAARAFVANTFSLVRSGQPHVVAAAFTFGREEPIPDMFRNLLVMLDGEPGARVTLFRRYLDRHIEIDEAEHAPMAIRMLAGLCGEDPGKWEEARQAAASALAARLALWSAIRAEVAALRAATAAAA